MRRRASTPPVSRDRVVGFDCPPAVYLSAPGRKPAWMKGLKMTRRVLIVCCKVLAAALLTWGFSVVTSPYTVHAQGAIAQVQGDPTGAATGTAKDVPVKDAANPTLTEVMEVVGHNRIAINFVWTLLAG